MNAADRAMANDELERRLRSWMGEQGPDTDLTPTYDGIVDATRGTGQRPWFLVRRGVRRTIPLSERRFVAERVAMAVLVVLVVTLALAAGLLVGSRLSHPHLPLPPLPTAVSIDGQSAPQVGTTYTSRVFGQPMTFQLTPRTPDQPGTVDICPGPSTSPRSIVFAHPKGCVEELRIIRPWAVACGAVGDHPDADQLAAAILAIPATSGSADLGDLQTSTALPAGMFAGAYGGRVVQMSGYAPLFAGDLVDRDHCRLLPEPGSDDPAIEIRRDLTALFVLIDLDGELVVIRASGSGYDAASGSEALSRGYALGDATALRHTLGLITDVQFGQRADTPGSSVPP